MIDHDRLFKQLLTSFFEEFLELFAPEVLLASKPKSIRFRDREIFRDLPGSERRVLDIVAEVELSSGRSAILLVHVEIQSQTMPQFNQRMFFYFSRLYEQSGLPVYPIALFTYDDASRVEQDALELTVIDLDVLRFRFISIELRKLNWRRYLRHHNPIATALMAKMGYAEQERPKVKAECLRLLAALSLDTAGRALIGCFIDTYLALDPAEQAEYNRIVEGFPMQEQQSILDLTTSWERKGRAEGRAEGRLKGQVELLIRLAERRFGPLSPDDEMLMRGLPSDQLELLADAIIDAADSNEWRAHLLGCKRTGSPQNSL